jgi:outer membrane murein-binding lipoprotein Lpp
LTPSQIAGPEVSTSYLDQLRKRVLELEAQMKQLDEDFKSGRINGDEYAEHHVRLKQIRAGIQDELQRQGVVG